MASRPPSCRSSRRATSRAPRRSTRTSRSTPPTCRSRRTSAGADIVYAAAGGSGAGVFEAASESGTKAIGVDSDQYNTADPSVKDVIMTSMLKNVDVAVYEYLKSVAGGTFPTGVTTYDLKVDGVGYSTSGGFIDDITSKLDDYKQQIIDGKITVPTTP
ncbi:BMP family protein [Nocardioides hankookensis]